MTQADRVLSTPPTNTPTSSVRIRGNECARDLATAAAS
jgi:hypothetical protein